MYKRQHIRDISFRTYYRKRREAIDALSSVLWGYTSKDSLDVLEQFFPCLLYTSLLLLKSGAAPFAGTCMKGLFLMIFAVHAAASPQAFLYGWRNKRNKPSLFLRWFIWRRRRDFLALRLDALRGSPPDCR